jgi:CRP-like cAMP-binding protein
MNFVWLLRTTYAKIITMLANSFIRVGDPAHDLFILYSGNVRLYLPAEVEGDVLATHKQGDFFGHEVLEERGVRRTTAQAINDVTVLAFDEPHLVFPGRKCTRCR